ncbi:MAG: hypothetical protein AMXMBFR82_44160 [Candidatus Hydrogenedentota bacterium]
MDKPLNSDTIAALRELAREVGDLRGLDEDALEELYGHLEDKTLGYLSGEEGLSEADAVLLTREHFGMSGTMASMEVPVRSGAFARRLAAIAVYDLVLGMVLISATIAVSLTVFPYLDATPPGVRTVIDWASIWRLLLPSAILILPLVAWGVIRLCKRKQSARRQVWYLRWNPYLIAAVLVVLLTVRKIQHADPLGSMRVVLDSHKLPAGFFIIGLAMSLVPVIWACVWMHWVARTNRSTSSLIAGAVIWFLIRMVSGRFPDLLLNLPLIVTVTIIFVLANRLPTRNRGFERGVPWISD